MSSFEHRQSNMELLRIISMLFVVMQHFWGHAFYPGIGIGEEGYLAPFLVYFVHGFLFVAVNCFILISGFFRIKTTWKKLLNFFVLCSFYALLTNSFNRIMGGGSIGRGVLINSILVFSHDKYWWFIRCYLVLMLVAPILNKAIDVLQIKEFQYSLLLLAILDVYLGFFWGWDNGFSSIHFVIIYLLGSYINRYPIQFKRLNNRAVLLSIYMICATIWALLSFINNGQRIPHWTMISYNNPFIIVASVAFFLFFATFELHNSFINMIGRSAIAAYLLQEGIDEWIYPRYADLFLVPSFPMRIGVLILTSLSWFLLAIIIDQVRLSCTKLINYLINAVPNISRFK